MAFSFFISCKLLGFNPHSCYARCDELALIYRTFCIYYIRISYFYGDETGFAVRAFPLGSQCMKHGVCMSCLVPGNSEFPDPWTTCYSLAYRSRHSLEILLRYIFLGPWIYKLDLYKDFFQLIQYWVSLENQVWVTLKWWIGERNDYIRNPQMTNCAFRQIGILYLITISVIRACWEFFSLSIYSQLLSSLLIPSVICIYVTQ
jgi:hypothetical protein